MFDDQPASATPYTPIEVTPRINSSPMFTSVICSGMLYGQLRRHPNGTAGSGDGEWPEREALPNGITEIEVSAKITAIIGAARNSGL